MSYFRQDPSLTSITFFTQGINWAFFRMEIGPFFQPTNTESSIRAMLSKNCPECSDRFARSGFLPNITLISGWFWKFVRAFSARFSVRSTLRIHKNDAQPSASRAACQPNNRPVGSFLTKRYNRVLSDYLWSASRAHGRNVACRRKVLFPPSLTWLVEWLHKDVVSFRQKTTDRPIASTSSPCLVRTTQRTLLHEKSSYMRK